MNKTDRDHIIPKLHTLIGFLHQKSMDVAEGTLHGTKVVTLYEWEFYKKNSFTERQQRKIWGYDIIATKSYL